MDLSFVGYAAEKDIKKALLEIQKRFFICTTIKF